MQITAIALGGMERAGGRVDLAASRLSQAADPEAGGDIVDLSQEIVSLLEARTDFQTQVKVMQTAQEMDTSLFAADMIDS
jgi:hypothetical protein